MNTNEEQNNTTEINDLTDLEPKGEIKGGDHAIGGGSLSSGFAPTTSSATVPATPAIR